MLNIKNLNNLIINLWLYKAYISYIVFAEKGYQGHVEISNYKSFLNFQKYHKNYSQTNHSELYTFQ